MPLNPFHQQLYDSLKEPTPDLPSDHHLIEAAELAKQELRVINKDLQRKYGQLIQQPKDLRDALELKQARLIKQIAQLQEDLAVNEEELEQCQAHLIKGEKAYASIKEHLKPQIIALETQAAYVPLSMRALMYKRRANKPQQDD